MVITTRPIRECARVGAPRCPAGDVVLAELGLALASPPASGGRAPVLGAVGLAVPEPGFPAVRQQAHRRVVGAESHTLLYAFLAVVLGTDIVPFAAPPAHLLLGEAFGSVACVFSAACVGLAVHPPPCPLIAEDVRGVNVPMLDLVVLSPIEAVEPRACVLVVGAEALARMLDDVAAFLAAALVALAKGAIGIQVPAVVAPGGPAGVGRAVGRCAFVADGLGRLRTTWEQAAMGLAARPARGRVGTQLLAARSGAAVLGAQGAALAALARTVAKDAGVVAAEEVTVLPT